MFLFFFILSATLSEKKYNQFWTCDPQVKKNLIRKHYSNLAFFIFVYFTFCSICCKAYFTTSRNAGGRSWFLYVVLEVMGSNPAQATNYVEALFKGIAVNKKNNKESTMSGRNLIFYFNWVIFWRLLIHNSWKSNV